jgi:hypothetical protein
LVITTNIFPLDPDKDGFEIDFELLLSFADAKGIENNAAKTTNNC